MSQFDTSMAALAGAMNTAHGRAAVYNTRNSSGVITARTDITQARITFRGQRGYHDPHGKFHVRAMDIAVAFTELAAVSDGDTFTVDGEDWSIQEWHKHAAEWRCVCVRYERQTATVTPQRKERAFSPGG